MMMKWLKVAVTVLLLATPVQAAESISAKSGATGLTAENTWVTLSNISGFGSVGADIRGTFTATLNVQCSVNGTDWKNVRMTPPDSTTAVTSMTSVGTWANGAIAGCWKVRIGIDTGNFTSGAAHVVIRATVTGGGGGSGGGAGGSVTVTDGVDTALVSAGGELLVSCADCSGSGVSHVDDAAFTPATDDVVPIAGVFDDVATDSVNEGDAGAVRMSANRNLFTAIRDAAGNERGANVNASNELLVAVSSIPSHAVTNAGTFAVQVSSAIPAGTNNIGDVDVLTVPTDPFGANADAASATGSISAKLRFIASTGIPITGTVTVGSHAVTNAGTFVVQENGAALTALQLIDNAVGTVAAGTAATASLFAGGQYNSTPITLTNTQGAALQLDANGYLKVNTAAGAAAGGTSSNFGSAFPTPGTAVGFTDGTNMVGGTILTTQADNLANTTDGIVTTALLYCFDGSTWDRCPTSTGGSGTIDANTQRVVIATDDPVNDFAVKLDAQMVADDAATAGNPIYIGGLATASIVGQTPVAGADRIGFVGGLDRVLITRPYANLEDRVSAVVGVTDGSSTSLVAAQGAGVRFCATGVVVSNSSATNVTVDLRDGTAGSVVATFPAAANMGGAAFPLLVPICTTANTALAMDPSAAASTVTVTAIGFKTEL